MLRARVGDDPDRRARFHHRRVGDQLSEVVVVGPFQLVLNHDNAAAIVFGDEINAKGTSGALALNVAERQVERVVENVDVVLQPSREVVSLVRPDGAERDALDLPDARADAGRPDLSAAIDARLLGNAHA